jgi:hypothetical protein
MCSFRRITLHADITVFPCTHLEAHQIISVKNAGAQSEVSLWNARKYPGPYYPLGTIGIVPRAHDIIRAYERMEGRKNKNK